MSNKRLEIDPIHDSMDPNHIEVSRDIWTDKYRWGDEDTQEDPLRRVVEGVYVHDPSQEHKEAAKEALMKRLFCPGGRVLAGAGTDKVVTAFNCYVMSTIPDSMEGISEVLRDSMLTMQQGGGIGMDFSTLRPTGAYLARTQAVASGPLPFMDMWDSMCSTIMSAGSRRGAMMGVLHCEHPDLPEFIKAKQEPGRLTNFNLSVLVSDAFMDAVTNDEDWYLGFPQPRADGQHLFIAEREDDDDWYVYDKWKARDLWEMITQSTYEYSEPGVIFIDKVNDNNPLQYCEEINATNPCGEQPLPPNGCCNLGSVNLARMVKRPFKDGAWFDYDLLDRVTRIGVRFLDNTIDIANFPLDKQRQEELSKRRIGLGITGLGDALMQLKIRYGTERALQTTDAIMAVIKNAAADESALLAEERGAFPMYSPEWGVGTTVYDSLNPDTQRRIYRHGVRNGTLLTIAPTGTTSIFMGNVSSGLEPVFSHSYTRKVLQPDDTLRDYTVSDYGYELFRKVHGDVELPSYMVTALELSVDAHVRVQSVCQKHVDTSISKTINCPEDMSFEDFKLVYWDTYASGCKGCTTFRPNPEVRDSILSTGEEKEKRPVPDRPEVLEGKTYKIKWPHSPSSYYVTINDDPETGKPFEMFITSTNSQYQDWTTALSLMISAIMRKGDDISFIPEELSKVVSVTDFAWIKGNFYGSLVALIGEVIRNHINEKEQPEIQHYDSGPTEGALTGHLGSVCSHCGMPTVVAQEGCKSCLSCGASDCG